MANIDPHGDWIRLRPAKKYEPKQAIVIGKPTPDWQAVTLKNNKISSESLKGKYVLLNFWGSWCGPCIQEIPLLKKLYVRYQDQNFEIIGFAYESQQSLSKAIKKYQLSWPQVLDDESNYSSMFLVRGYPTHYLVGPKGNVIEMGSDLKDENLISTLEKYLE